MADYFLNPCLSIELSNYDFTVFDCDGVILDSNSIKSEAFANSLNDEPNSLIKSFITYHKQHGGVSRYEKFKHYFNNIKKTNINEAQLKLILNRFAKLVKTEMLECEFVPGALKFIKKIKAKEIPIFVVSGSDEKELNEIFLKRDILDLFVNVFGSPLDKHSNLEKVIKIIGDRKKGIFFGDSNYDYTTSIKYGLDFIFVRGYSEWNPGSKTKKNIKYIDNFSEIII